MPDIKQMTVATLIKDLEELFMRYGNIEVKIVDTAEVWAPLRELQLVTQYRPAYVEGKYPFEHFIGLGKVTE